MDLTWFFHRGPATLADPAACPGALDLAAIGLARLSPASPLGPTVLVLNAALAVVAIALFVWTAARLTQNWLAAIALGTGVAALPLFDTRLALFEPAAFAAACVTLLALSISAGDREPGRPRWLVVSGMAATAAITPSSGWLLAPLAAWSVEPTAQSGAKTRRLLAGLAVLAPVAIVTFAMSSGVAPDSSATTCLRPSFESGRFFSLDNPAAVIVRSAGPYVLGLAVLATFVSRRRLLDTQVLTVFAYVAISFVSAASTESTPGRDAAPAVAAWWLAAGVGLAEMIRVCGQTVGGRVAAAALLAIVPWQGAEMIAEEELVPRPEVHGQNQLTLNDVRRMTNLMPTGGVLVTDDAITHALVSATRSTRPDLAEVANRPFDLSADIAVSKRRLFAWPAARTSLEYFGFQAGEYVIPGPAPLTEMRIAGQCLQLNTAWRVIAPMQSHDTFTMAARSPGEEGPIVIYATTADRPSPQPLAWPPRSTRGFYVTTYARATSKDVAQLAQDLSDDGLPDQPAVTNAPFVTRLELWRTPGAPLALAFSLGTPPTFAIGHVLPKRAQTRMTICTAFVRP